MTGITQQIPDFIQGISDQPDELKKPGQVRDLVNGFPDPIRGLSKRPGMELVSELEDTLTDGGTWFHIVRESVEGNTQRFICRIGRAGKVQIWNADTGKECPIYWNNGSPIKTDDLPINLNTTAYPLYANHCDYFKYEELINELQDLTINDFTFVTNTERVVNMSASQPITKNKGFIELTQLAYNRSYDLDVNFLDTDGTASYRTATEAKILAVENKIDDRGEGCGSVGTFNVTLSENDETYPGSVRDNRASGLRVELRTLGDLIQVDNDGNQDDYQCRYTHFLRLQSGGQYWTEGDLVSYQVDPADPDSVVYRLEITETQNIDVSAEVAIRGVNTPNNADTSLSASFVLDALKDELEDEGFTVQLIGNGLYLEHSDPFVVTSPEPDLFNILNMDDSDDKIMIVNDVSRLPVQCKKNIVVKVANSFNDQDDYFVKFISADGVEDAGDGHWEEVAKPGEFVTLNPDSMPHAIVKCIKTENGEKVDAFIVTAIDWNSRNCGTEDFNPSFVEKKINNLFLFRSRLSFLSGENVIMSRPNDLFNFFPVSALTVSPSDPIDLSASTKSSAVLHDAIVVTSGVILFSEFNQFLLATDSDTLRPETAKITQLASYDFLTSL